MNKLLTSASTGSRLMIACVMFALASCGGGGSQNSAMTSPSTVTSNQTDTGTQQSPPDTTTPTTTPSAPPSSGTSSGSTPSGGTATVKKIEFYGDSTIRGYLPFSGEIPSVTTPQAFAAALPSSPPYVVSNEGVNSSKVSQLLAGTDGVHPPWDEQMANSTASIIITNHCSQYGSDVATYTADMRKLAQIARSHGKTILFMTPNQTAGGAGFYPYVEAMREAARLENVPVIEVYNYLEDYMASTGKNVSDIVPDGYHPTSEVYVLIGKYAASIFQNLAK